MRKYIITRDAAGNKTNVVVVPPGASEAELEAAVQAVKDALAAEGDTTSVVTVEDTP